METKIITTRLIFILGLWFLTACSQELELKGVFHSESDANERFEQSQTFNAAIADRLIVLASNDYYLAFGGDAHVGDTANLKALIDSASFPGVAALVLCGDNTTGLQEDYDVLKGLLSKVTGSNVFLTCGNHDLYHAGWATYYPYFGASAYTVEVKTPDYTDLIIVIDNASDSLGSKQLEWLEQVLTAQRGNFRHCIVAGHVNFFRNRFTISTNPPTEEVQALIDMFAENNVDMLVSGHDHERYVEVFGPTTYITMDCIKDVEPNSSWMKVKVTNDSLSHRFIEF